MSFFQRLKSKFTTHPKEEAAAKTQKSQEQAAKKAAMNKEYQAFLEGEGKLPEGLSAPYNTVHLPGVVFHNSPFEAYLKTVNNRVDRLNDRSGISDWLHLDGSAEINEAAAALSVCIRRHREMNDRMYDALGWRFECRFRCRKGEPVMVVLDDPKQFEKITGQTVQVCKAEGISFCTLVSDRRLYDLMEQAQKEIICEEYPNYHDETYADWFLRNCKDA